MSRSEIIRYTLVLFNLFFVARIVGGSQPQSPCPGIFNYRYDNRSNLYGEVRLENKVLTNIVNLKIQLSMENIVKGYEGNIETAKSKYRVQQDLLHCKPILYIVKFPEWTINPPEVRKIYVNGKLICSGRSVPDETRFHTSLFEERQDNDIQLSHGNNLLISPHLDVESLGKKFRIYKDNPFFTSNMHYRPEDILKKFEDKTRFHTSLFEKEHPSFRKNVPFTPHLDVGNLEKQFGINKNNPFFTSSERRLHHRPEDVLKEFEEKTRFHKRLLEENPFFMHHRHISKDGEPSNITPRPVRRSNITPRPVRRSNITPLPMRRSNITPRPTRPSNIAPLPMHAGKNSSIMTCGQPMLTNYSMGDMEVMPRGAYPWLGAIYRIGSSGFRYICTASLISDRHVVTAAHCVREGRDQVVNPEQIFVILGKLNLQRIGRYTEGERMIEPESILMHPDYRKISAEGDIAVLVLRESVQFSKYIMPLCLWSEDTELRNIVGTVGLVVGWGENQKGVLTTDEPKETKLRIVSQETCLTSSAEYYFLLSERTFCAGIENGNGPCHGNSGGGFIIKRNGRWTLRGVVSMSLSDPTTQSCDLTKYIVFTDASKYLDWLRKIIG